MDTTYETNRQAASLNYKNLFKVHSDDYNDILKLVAQVCEVPCAMVVFVGNGENSSKAYYDNDFVSQSNIHSFCINTINSEEEITIVSDCSQNDIYLNNPNVKSGILNFYAGYTLVNYQGFKIGTLCITDVVAREINAKQIETLKILGKQLMVLLEHEYQNNVLNNLKKNLELQNEYLEKFACMVSHDLKSPLANIMSLTSLIEEDNSGKFSSDSELYIQYLHSSANSLKNYIDGVLGFYKSINLVEDNFESVNLEALILEVKNILSVDSSVQIETDFESNLVFSNKSVLQQIILNLVSNAIRYNSREQINIKIIFYQDIKYYHFEVIDNGIGIAKEHYNKIFEIFQTLGESDRNNQVGSGIGLSTVKKVVESLGGSISVHSVVGEGSKFNFSILK